MPATAKTTAKPGKTTVAKKTAAPAKQETAAKKSARSTAASPARKSASQARPPVSPDQRRNYVEVAAYYIAERHGFMPGRELADWAAAEAEIDRLLAEGRLHP